MKFITAIKLALYGINGALLASAGIGLDAWQFWVSALVVGFAWYFGYVKAVMMNKA